MRKWKKYLVLTIKYQLDDYAEDLKKYMTISLMKIM